MPSASLLLDKPIRSEDDFDMLEDLTDEGRTNGANPDSLEEVINYELMKNKAAIMSNIVQEDTQCVTNPMVLQIHETSPSDTQPNAPKPNQYDKQKIRFPIPVSQPILGPEVEVNEQSMLTDETDANVTNEVKVEIEWEEIAAIALARSQGKYWDQEGLEEVLMSEILDGRVDTTPMIAYCIKLLYDYESEDEMEESDEVH